MTPEEALKFCANYITYLFNNISGAARPIFNSIMFQAIINQDQLTINFLLSKGLTTYDRVADIQRLVNDLRLQNYDIEDVPRDNNCFFWCDWMIFP